MALKVFGGEILLQWKEPRKARQAYARTLAWPQRLWFQHRGAFLTGCGLGVVMAITSGLSASDAGLGRLLLVTSISSLVAGLFFALIYGLTNLVRPRIYVRDTCIVRSRRRASERWNYVDLKRYTITEVLIGVDSIRSLTIEMRNGGEATVEIADHIDDLDVRRVLDRRIRSHQR